MIEHATEVRPILLHISPNKTAVFSRHTARSAVPSQSDDVCFGSKANVFGFAWMRRHPRPISAGPFGAVSGFMPGWRGRLLPAS
jgi:hypothetical protein